MDNLAVINNYVSGSGFYVFPVREKPSKFNDKKTGKQRVLKEKTPYTKNGFKDATKDKNTIKQWSKYYPGCMWGLATGLSNLVVIDFDFNKREGLIIPPYCSPTKSIRTAHSGSHLLYKSNGYKVDSGTAVLGEGIDIRAEGGYSILPPSTIIQEWNSGSLVDVNYPYSWSNNLPIADLPEELFKQIQNKKGKPEKTENVKKTTQAISGKDNNNSHDQVIIALSKLSQDRCDTREQWLNVGMALHNGFDGSQVGLALWDNWSRRSSKYEEGVCSDQWNSFDNDKDNKITINSLFYWAEEDGKGTFIRFAPKNAKPSHYMNALHTTGYSFTMNRMNDRIYVNGNLLTDSLLCLFMTKLRENGYLNKGLTLDAIIAEGEEHQFHPIEEYLTSLVWDGNDHITKLSTYFQDEDNIFPVLIRKWLIGAVSKIFNPFSSMEQNPMLVLDGKQGKGKSVFVAWLGNVLPDFFIASPIYPDNKDFVINSASHFVWEVEELGSTIRKADREALKAFLLRHKVSLRPPYGRFEIQKPVTCSYIGTLNDEGGFLNDPTGSRRYRVCKITSINWNYHKELNPNQVWAQAVALFRQGETYTLEQPEQEKIEEINERYEIDDPLAIFILDSFTIDKTKIDSFITTSQIISTLKLNGLPINETDRQISMRISSILTKLDLNKKRKWVGKNHLTGWDGIILTDKKNKETPF